MEDKKFALCHVDAQYLRFLRSSDSRISQKNNRPFLAFAVYINEQHYAIPITSQTFRLNKDGIEDKTLRRNPLSTDEIKVGNNYYGAILHNNMIPIHESLIQIIDIDNESAIEQSRLLPKVQFIRKHFDDIVKKSNKVYDIVTKEKRPFFVKFCCDFEKLEKQLKEYCILLGIGISPSEEEKLHEPPILDKLADCTNRSEQTKSNNDIEKTYEFSR